MPVDLLFRKLNQKLALCLLYCIKYRIVFQYMQYRKVGDLYISLVFTRNNTNRLNFNVHVISCTQLLNHPFLWINQCDLVTFLPATPKNYIMVSRHTKCNIFKIRSSIRSNKSDVATLCSEIEFAGADQRSYLN